MEACSNSHSDSCCAVLMLGSYCAMLAIASTVPLIFLPSCMQANSDADEVDIFLIVTLLQYICGEGAYQRDEEGGLMLGAVLVFLPGAEPCLTHSFLSSLLTHCSLFGSLCCPCTARLIYQSLITAALSAYSQRQCIFVTPSGHPTSCLLQGHNH